MQKIKTDLSNYNNKWYRPGGSYLKRALWYCVNATFFISYFPFNGLKIILLKIFGARIGNNVIIKPSVNIKFPWNLVIGSNVWIGEKTWIDNLALVTIHDHVCVSQGALLLTGNHDYKKSSFDLLVNAIVLEEGVWVGAKSIVCPGVHCASHSVLSAGSVAVHNLEPYGIYQGNPALKIREREIS